VRSHFDCRLGRGPFSITTSVQSDKLALALDEIHTEVLSLLGDRPPTQAELDSSRRALVEGQTRQFETPAALVNRYANLFMHGLPIDHYNHFSDRLSEIDLAALNAALHRQIHPNDLIAVVVADAADAVELLKRLDWAELEIIED
jgi:predicted Zn-dependent peptidase